MNRRLKLLFLAHRFPPAETSACVRTASIAKYLAKLGWEVTVVTPDPAVWRRVEQFDEKAADHRRYGIRTILTAHQWPCLLPDLLKYRDHGVPWFLGGLCRRIARRFSVDNGIGWVKPAMEACRELTAQDVDVILATGKPFAAFALAKLLSDRLGRPYVLDYRDPWTEDARSAHSPHGAAIKQEARLLNGSAAVTIVSESWAKAMGVRFGLGRKLHVITNGYDPERIAQTQAHHFGHFAIVYAGIFYPPSRAVTPLMAALRTLKEATNHNEGSEWFFHYYGPDESHVRVEAQRFGVSERVVIHGMVPRVEALSAVRGAGVAVVITSVVDQPTLDDKGIVTGKIFEALGLGTRVLLIAPPGSDAEIILQKTGLGRCYSGSDVQGMASFLKEAMSGWAPNSKSVEAYAWRNIAKRLDTILRGAIIQQEGLSERVA